MNIRLRVTKLLFHVNMFNASKTIAILISIKCSPQHSGHKEWNQIEQTSMLIF